MKYRLLLIPSLFVAMLLLVPFLTATVHAEIYKWVDDQGNVHFSDNKPKDRESEKQDYPAGENSPDPEMARHRQQMDEQLQQWEQQEAQEKEAREIAEKQKQRNEYNCNVAKSNLLMDDSVSVVYARSADGKKKALTADERKKRRDLMEKQKAQYCR